MIPMPSTSTHQDTARKAKVPRWVRSLNRVAELNRQTDPLLVRQSLLENLDRLTETALSRARVRFVGEDGTRVETPDPDVRTALQAQLAAARLLGVDEARDVLMLTDARQLDDLVSQARRALKANREAKILTLPAAKVAPKKGA
jgi:hypothetical protein